MSDIDDQANVILEVELHETGDTALIGFDSAEEAARVLEDKGFVRQFGEDMWVGLDAYGREVSVMPPMLVPPHGLIEVTQGKGDPE